MNFVSELMDFVVKMMEFVLKMVNLMQISRTTSQQEPEIKEFLHHDNNTAREWDDILETGKDLEFVLKGLDFVLKMFDFCVENREVLGRSCLRATFVHATPPHDYRLRPD